jgi:hypothetical protein
MIRTGNCVSTAILNGKWEMGNGTVAPALPQGRKGDFDTLCEGAGAGVGAGEGGSTSTQWKARPSLELKMGVLAVLNAH